jgi:signal transduction histidine kinase
MRRRFLWRIGVFLAVFVALLLGIGHLLSRTVAGGGRPYGLFWALVLVVAIVGAVRWVRRTAGPIGEVMEAADRVAGGDYAVRVSERGPPDVRRLARRFNDMTERLQESEERRRRLLADVAHEVRTPLSVIRGDVEGMLDGVYPADAEHLGRLLDQSDVLARLLDDLRTPSTAQAGQLRLHPEPVDPAALVEGAVAAFAARAGSEGVELLTEVPEGLPALEVDPVRIGEVLSNLLSNAVRHTPRGGRVSIAPSADREAVRFSVSDTGPGIAPEVLPHLFERFTRSADTGGSGLGLAIAKSLVEAHGGTIGAESPPPAGRRSGSGSRVRDASRWVRHEGAQPPRRGGERERWSR